jgi:hypothetical protein
MELEEKAKKEQRTAGGERGRSWRSRQEAREERYGAQWGQIGGGGKRGVLM